MLSLSRKQKKIAVLLLSVLILAVAVGATLAYIVSRTEPTKNVFVPVAVDTEPVQTAPGKMAVSNTGDVPAYIRAKVIVNWVAVSEDGVPENTYHAQAPVAGVDYSISFDDTGYWKMGADGIWYYAYPVNAGEFTMNLVTAVERLAVPPKGYVLSVEIVSTGIQTEPVEAVQSAWNVTVSGTMLTPNE